VNTIEKINELSLASLGQWGVEIVNDNLWECIHDLTVAHTPTRIRQMPNRFIGVDDVAVMMIDEVHGDIVDQGLISRKANV